MLGGAGALIAVRTAFTATTVTVNSVVVRLGMRSATEAVGVVSADTAASTRSIGQVPG